MRKVWIRILNEIINANNEITLNVKLSRTNMVIDINDYNTIIKQFPHFDTLKAFIDRLSNAGCTINEIENHLDGNTLTEEYIYIIKKPNELMAETRSRFLYELDKIELECINDEYTGNLIPQQISGIVQKLIIHTDNNIFTVDITSINSNNLGIINIHKKHKSEFYVTETIDLLYERYSNDNDLLKHELEKNKYASELIKKILTILKLYRPYL